MGMVRDSDLPRTKSTSGASLRQNAAMPVLFSALSMLAMNAIDPTRCPLCGEANVCALEIERQSGVAQPPCWCLSTAFSASLQAQLPAEARGQACICARCVAKAAPTATT